MPLFDPAASAPAITLADLLKIEDTADLLAFQCPVTSIPVWPNIRVAFFRQIMADMLFASGSIDPPAQKLSARAAGVLGRAALHNARGVIGRQLRADVLINTEAVGDELRESLWFNRYVDPFGDVTPGEAVVLTDLFEWQWRAPRHNPRIVYHAPVQMGATLASRLRRGPGAIRLARDVMTLACDRAQAALGWRMESPRRAAFETWVAGKIAGLPFRYRAYRRLLRHVRPRLLLGSSGCYGAHAPLMAAANDAGVVTAEYQHGAISAGHDAYNFAPAIFDSASYRRTLPRYLLTYGSWWSSQVNVPVERVAIGYPARAAKMERLSTGDVGRRNVLVLSDGIEFQLYLELARTIQASGRGLPVVLRPHPLERSSVLQRYGTKVDGVAIDAEPDIYRSFATAHAVVSELSTGLFEAVGLVDRIILLDTAKARFAFPEHPFASARSVEEVVALIDNDAQARVKVDETALWTPGWQKMYRRFLSEQVGIDG